MNRNTNSHFSTYPIVTMNRSQFDRSHSVKLTFPTGKLIPFEIDEVLPGDTFSVDTAAVCRMATPLYPVMGDAFLDFYYFFVPTRLVWNHTEEFYGANNLTYWENPTEYFIPEVDVSEKSGLCSVADYFGIPLNCKEKINALPFRAYGLIWNEWFRNQNFQDPVLVTGDDQEDASLRDYYDLLPVTKYKDYFTTCLPAPQKGQAITLPFAAFAPVVTRDGDDPGYVAIENNFKAIEFNISNGSTNIPVGNILEPLYLKSGANRIALRSFSDTESSGIVAGDPIISNPRNLFADLTSATATNVNDLRLAFQLQRILERQARSGSRFTEYLASTFGVRSPDARLQRPEYLGGSKTRIEVNQVIQTSSTISNSPLGETGAYSKTISKSDSFTHSFVEPGYLIGVACVRYIHNYQNGLERLWSRRQRFDFYDPALAHIGEQAVLKKEIYCPTMDNNFSNGDDVFGYQEAWADYRYKPNRVCGDFRSNAPDGSLDSWIYVDNYNTDPTLSAEWINEDPEPLANTLALTDVDDTRQFIADIYIQNKATRVMPVYSIPGLIDHF